MEKTNIYILHYAPLTERKSFQKKQLSKLNINNYSFTEIYDKEKLTKKDIDQFIVSNDFCLSAVSLFKKFMYALSLIQKMNINII